MLIIYLLSPVWSRQKEGLGLCFKPQWEALQASRRNYQLSRKHWWKEIRATSRCVWWIVANWWMAVCTSAVVNKKRGCTRVDSEWLTPILVSQWMTSVAQMIASNMSVPTRSYYYFLFTPIFVKRFLISLFHCIYFLLKTLERWKTKASWV